MPDQEIILDVEREASDKELYKIVPDERKDKREYRTGKIAKNITSRLTELSKYTGMARFNMDINLMQQKALGKVLIKKGIATDGEIEDIFNLCVDEHLRNLESNKDKIRQARFNQNLQNKLANKKLIITGKMPPPIRG